MQKTMAVSDERLAINNKINRFNKNLDEILNRYSVLDNKDKSYFFARRVRKGRKVLFPLVFHADAGGVANFVTTRERKAVASSSSSAVNVQP